ncbi:MAG: hypothetical protein F6K56_30805 [Moorea sp. SIO3G5]|nr:hypothetical protein [Moorena sp. SIO3G5]
MIISSAQAADLVVSISASCLGFFMNKGRVTGRLGTTLETILQEKISSVMYCCTFLSKLHFSPTSFA